VAFQVKDFDQPVPRDAISKEFYYDLSPDMHGVTFVRRLDGFAQLPYAFGHTSIISAKANA
jgi:hypothetical protein